MVLLALLNGERYTSIAEGRKVRDRLVPYRPRRFQTPRAKLFRACFNSPLSKLSLPQKALFILYFIVIVIAIFPFKVFLKLKGITSKCLTE